MNLPPRLPAVARVWVALSRADTAGAALGLASDLAAELQAEIAGLFVEDIDLVRLAALPFAGETGLMSTTWRPFGAGELENLLRLHAERAHRMLVEAAAQIGVACSFRVSRGVLAHEALDASGEAEAIVLCAQGVAPGWITAPVGAGARTPPRTRSARAPSEEAPGPTAMRPAVRHAATVSPPRRAARRAAVVVFDGSSAALRALGLGAALAAGVALHVLAVGNGAASAAERRRSAMAWLNERGVAGVVRTLPRFEAAAVLEALADQARALLLVPAPALAADPDALSRLLSGVRGPLVLVR